MLFRSSDVLVGPESGAQVLRATHNEVVGGFRGYTEDLDVRVSLAWSTFGWVLDPGCTRDQVGFELGTHFVRFYLFTRSSIGLHKRTGFLQTPIYLRVDGTGSANVVKSVVEGCKWLR